MPKKSKTDTFFQRDKHIIEITSGQLIFVIAALIVVGVICFALGLLVAGSPANQNRYAANTAPGPSGQGDGTSEPAPPTENGAGNQTTPRVPFPEGEERTDKPFEEVIVEVEAPEKAGDPIPPANETPEVPDSTEPEAAAPEEEPQADPPSVAENPSVQIDPPEEDPTNEKPDEEAAKMAEPQKQSDEPAKTTPSPTSEQTAPQETESTNPDPPVEKATPQPTSVVTGKFAIQVAAFNELDREDRAKEHLRLIHSNSEYRGRVDSAGDGWSRVYIGDFSDEASAKAARQEMAKKAGFAECWVKKLD
jgi:cell division protein FtsN